MTRYCLICKKEWGAEMPACCAEGSLVATKVEGLFRKKRSYFTLDGTPLTTKELEEMKRVASARPKPKPPAASPPRSRSASDQPHLVGTQPLEQANPTGTSEKPGCVPVAHKHWTEKIGPKQVKEVQFWEEAWSKRHGIRAKTCAFCQIPLVGSMGKCENPACSVIFCPECWGETNFICHTCPKCRRASAKLSDAGEGLPNQLWRCRKCGYYAQKLEYPTRPSPNDDQAWGLYCPKCGQEELEEM